MEAKTDNERRERLGLALEHMRANVEELRARERWFSVDLSPNVRSLEEAIAVVEAYIEQGAERKPRVLEFTEVNDYRLEDREDGPVVVDVNHDTELTLRVRDYPEAEKLILGDAIYRRNVHNWITEQRLQGGS